MQLKFIAGDHIPDRDETRPRRIQSNDMRLFRSEPVIWKASLLSVLLLFLFVSFSNAQRTKHKKRSHKKTAVSVQKPVAPPVVTSDPIIVSRASDYQDQAMPVAATVTNSESPAETRTEKELANLAAHIKRLESEMKNGYDEKQKRLLLNLDILTKAEQRAESLRKQRFELIEKENQIQSRLDQIEVEIRPDSIERSVATAGSLRPEELREARRKSLDSERKNLQSLLTQVQSTRGNLEQSADRADQLVQKLRATLEADIDKTLGDDKDKLQ